MTSNLIMNDEMNYEMNLNNRCTSQRGVSTFTDGCDLTPIYSVCATRDISECGSLNKGLNHQTMNQQTIKFNIKGGDRHEIKQLELSYIVFLILEYCRSLC